MKLQRVICLYRVSTKKQVDKNENDIPMQKTACWDFASSKPDWTIVKEYSEKGISGYKVSADDRDAIQELKEAALNDEFDILLVFMFDRIGRIDDETPFVVEWFAKHGIQVWSVMEGQQRFDSHVDKLMNYLRFWQASGESEKTSMRIRSKMQQMIEDGLYTGGPVKYGYHLTDSGLVNRILKDRFYCGYLDDGTSTEALQALRIRSDETYAQILEILEQRNNANEEKRHIALRTKRKAMLSGNIFCAHCGGRLTTIRYRDHYTRADGSEYSVDQIKYSCYHKSRKLCKCDGQTTYQADRVDEIIRQIIRQIFSCMSGAPEEEKLQALLKRQIAGNKARQTQLEHELGKSREQLTKLQLEIAKTLTGESVYSPEDLTQVLRTVKENIANGEQELAKLKEEEAQKKQGIDLITPAYNQFKSWAEEFDTATLEQKKMIACYLFKRIEVGRGYQISVELNMTYQQFCTEWNNGDFWKTTAAV